MIMRPSSNSKATMMHCSNKTSWQCFVWWLLLLLMTAWMLPTVTASSQEQQQQSSCEDGGILHENGTCLKNNNNEDTKKSPGLYYADCRDDDARCGYWASEGFCDTENKYIKTNCRRSCPNICDNDEFDMGEPQEIASNNLDAKFALAQSLEYVRKVIMPLEDVSLKATCRNQHKLCTYWKTIGECDANPKYMTKDCAPACRSCDTIPIKERCKPDDNIPNVFGPGDVNRMFERITNDPMIQKKHHPTILSRPAVEKDDDDPNNNNKDGPWAILLDDFLSPEECDRLVELGAVEGYFRSEGGASTNSDSGVYQSAVSEYRTSYQAWCTDKCMEDPVPTRVSERIQNLTGIPVANSEFLQLLKYDQNQYYKVHNDFIPHHLERPMGPRLLTFFLYLNDVEEGGETRFPKLDVVVEPKKGRAVLWPSVLNENPAVNDDRTDHEALPITKGVKYGANAWLHQKDFKEAFARQCGA